MKLFIFISFISFSALASNHGHLIYTSGPAAGLDAASNPSLIGDQEICFVDNQANDARRSLYSLLVRDNEKFNVSTTTSYNKNTIVFSYISEACYVENSSEENCARIHGEVKKCAE